MNTAMTGSLNGIVLFRSLEFRSNLLDPVVEDQRFEDPFTSSSRSWSQCVGTAMAT